MCDADAARLLAGADGDLLAGADVVPVEGCGAVGSQGAGIHVGPQHQVVLKVLVFVGDGLGARADGAGRGVNIDMLALIRRAVVARRGVDVTRVELGKLRRLIT